MSRLLYIAKVVRVFIGRFKLVILAAAFFGILFFLLLRFLSPLIFIPVVKEGYVGGFVPDKMPRSIQLLVSEGLTKTDEEGQVLPALAASWETSDEGKTWTFHLDENKLWQDGKPVVSSTINYSFEDVQINRPDEKTIIFKLTSPFSPFPSIVSRPTFKKGLLGTGKWEVTKLSLAGPNVERIVLKSKDEGKKIIKFYPTEERAKLGFKLGEVDVLVDLIDPDPFDTWKSVGISKRISTNRYVAVFFNVQDSLLSDKSTRQALSYAVNKGTFEGERALGPISPLSWAANPLVKPYTFDIQRAKDLVSVEGEIKLVTTSALLAVAEQVAEFWNQIGLKTIVQVTSILPEEYQAFLVIYDVPSDPDQYSTWHSTQGVTNISKYTSPRIDKLLEDGRTELSQEERRKIYLDFQRFLLEDAPAAFLYHPVSYTISRK